MDDTSCERVRSVTITPDDDQYHLLLPAVNDLDDPIKDGKQRRTGVVLHENQLPKYDLDKQAAYQDEDLLCAGERTDDMFDTQLPTTKYSENPKEEEHANNNSEGNTCLEKRRLFSLMHSPGSSAFHSFDSSNSDPSSHSRHSLTSYLQARECDAEDILFSLGLGGDSRMTIPERFLINSSSSRGTIVDLNRRNIDDDDYDDICDANSMSCSSTWSDLSQVFERIPSRFISSTSSIGSNTDISEPEDNDVQNATLPVIIEPEQKDENSFDLMRHLRLNRIQNPNREHLVHGDRILLEPVTEELEVSSVGSGSARTKISNTQQDSLDSLGNTSVLTKISRKQESEERNIIENLSTSYEEEPLEDGQHLPDAETVDSLNGNKNGESNVRFVSVEKANKDSQTSTGDSESGISSLGESVLNINVQGALKPPVLGVLALRTPHDSFELEEIATSNENLDKIEEKKCIGKYIKAKSTRSLKRENSDESSGFEDDTQVKKQSTENLEVNNEKTSLIENNNDSDVNSNTNNNQIDLLVPFDCSTPETVQNRRSAFAKRNAWSTTSKQKRVAFHDEARERSRSFDEQSYLAYKLDTRRYSLDIPLSGDKEPQKDFLSETLIPCNKDTNKDRKTPEKTAVNNIKRFLSSLMSIRNRFRKSEQEDDTQTPIDLPTTDNVPNDSTSSVSIDVPSIVSIQTSDSNHVTLTHRSSLEEVSAPARDERKEPSKNDMECLVASGALQNSCIEELDSFEDDLKKYRATFLAIEATSTAQESYYTKKLLTRFAWDIVTIRKLRSLIIEELSTMQSYLTHRRLYVSKFSNIPLPPGIVDQMKCLLSLQSSLQTYLFNLAEHVPHFHWKTTERSTEDIANEIKCSIFQELKEMFKEQVDSLRKELQEKDTVINELLITVERIEKSTKISKQEN